MKILITGGSGLLGQYLNIELSKKHELLTLFNENPGNCVHFRSHQIDITDFNSLSEIFNSFKPDSVIHTAAVSNAQKADELPKDVVHKINVQATKRIAELCNSISAKLIYTSTDLVYDGNSGSLLNETSPLNPISLYAGTKLEAESAIQNTFDNFIILRTALLFGRGLTHSKNHFQEMLSKLKNNQPVKLFTDQYRTPLALHEAARIISELVDKNIEGELINFGGREKVSRYELGEILCEEGGFEKSLLIRSEMKDLAGIYPVADVSMNIDKLKSFGTEPKGIRQTIKEILMNR
ncbi:MAG: NAD(P)-dependent oxidoreductase [bacterium]